MRRSNLIAILVILLAAGAVWLWARGQIARPIEQAPIEEVNGRVGSEACASCHPDEFAAWKTSAHAHNMARPTEKTVLGDFTTHNEHRFDGTHSRMYREGDTWWMQYTNAEGQTEKYRIDWVLGVTRHQAYLHRFKDGRLQILPTYWNLEENAWRDSVEGPIEADGALPITHKEFWSNYGRTYNRVCMECHSSFSEKRFDEANGYNSVFDPAISCESCHGDGAAHVHAWRDLDGKDDPMPALGEQDLFGAIEVCAGCHARKRIYWDQRVAGEDFYDAFAPDVWEAGAFYVDGRSRTLNYRWVDYMQNRCAKTASRRLDCGHCHPPHDLHSVKEQTVTQSNTICTDCHLSHKTKLAEHTHHGVESAGSRCVDCHMPKMDLRLRMTVRDHTIGSPLPELTRRYQVPNACNQCHTKESVAWAEGWVDRWYGTRPTFQAMRTRLLERAEVLSAAFAGNPPVEPLIRWLDDPSRNLIERASAARLLGNKPKDAQALQALLRHATDPEPLVRYFTVRGLATFQQVDPLIAALQDPRRIVRVAAYASLVFLRPELVKSDDPQIKKVRAEYLRRRDVVRADDPRNKSNLALWALQQGDDQTAEALLKTHLAISPGQIQPYTNYARFLVKKGRVPEAEVQVNALKKFAAKHPDTRLIDALILMKQSRNDQAMTLLSGLISEGSHTQIAHKMMASIRRRPQP